MSLHDDAIELSQVLNGIVEALKAFKHPNQSNYTEEMAMRVASYADDFHEAISRLRSMEAAQDALDGLHPLMHNINGASTKGDLAIFIHPYDRLLDRYWTLYTIFRESRYEQKDL